MIHFVLFHYAFIICFIAFTLRLLLSLCGCVLSFYVIYINYVVV